MDQSFRRGWAIIIALFLIVTVVFPAIQLPVNAGGSEPIALPHGYFSGKETDPPFIFEGQLGYNFCYDSYPTAEVSEYIKYLEGFGLEAGATTRLLNGTQSRSIEYDGQLCLKINYRAADKILTVYLFQGKLEELGFCVAAEQEQPKGAAAELLNLENFFGVASTVEKDGKKTKHSFACSGYPQSQIDDYCSLLETSGLKQGPIFGRFGPEKTRKYMLDGDLCVEISWIEREKRLEVYIYDDVFEELKAAVDASSSASVTVPPTEDAADGQTGATPTVAAGMCKKCGLDFGTYDGYCYYCHPDFLFTCVICGNEQPYHRPPDGVCDACKAIQGAVDSVTGATG